jgi:hypothetical protein
MSELADHVERLADKEFTRAKIHISEFPKNYHAAMIIEMCRVMDFWHVQRVFAGLPPSLAMQDLDIATRGWNPALGLLLPHVQGAGVPLMESTDASALHAMSLLHQLGRYVTLSQASEMMRCGIAEGEAKAGKITLRMSERTAIDHFVDRVERETMADGSGEEDRFSKLIAATKVENLEERMAKLVFPWDPMNRGVMIGYDAEPDIDYHFIALVTKNAVNWRDAAGIHPNARIGQIAGADLTMALLLITSTYLKHISFVNIGAKKIPQLNRRMSLSIWSPMESLAKSMVDFEFLPHPLDMPTAAEAVNLIAARADQHQFFAKEVTPYFPMLLQISDAHFLQPITSILRDPFRGAREFISRRSNKDAAAIRGPREAWMVNELYHLFLGNRYQCAPSATMLKREGQILTDIDAAILDRTTGELALFQLKWQDWDTNDVRMQRSRAKNFIEDTDKWAERINGWVTEFGIPALAKALQLKLANRIEITEVRLFALGRSASKFRSYGFASRISELAACTWPQFVRLRQKIGPSQNVLRDLHDTVMKEQFRRIKLKPLPHEIRVGNTSIEFENFWNGYDETEVVA